MRIADYIDVAAPRLRIRSEILRRLPSKVTGVTNEELSFISADTYDMTATTSLTARMSSYDLDAAVRRWLDHLVGSDFGALELVS